MFRAARKVEEGTVEENLRERSHPYTKAAAGRLLAEAGENARQGLPRTVRLMAPKTRKIVPFKDDGKRLLTVKNLTTRVLSGPGRLSAPHGC